MNTNAKGPNCRILTFDIMQQLCRYRTNPDVRSRPTHSGRDGSAHANARKGRRTGSTASPMRGTQFFVPRTERQREYRDALRAPDPSILVATGPAGTAKTFGAVMVGLEKLHADDV